MIRTKPTQLAVIVLIGAEGPERDRFLAALTDAPLPARSSDGSAPLMARTVKGIVNGKQVWLVDAPPAAVSDAEMLEAVKNALECEMDQGHVTVHGLIYLHNMEESITKDKAQQNLATFGKLLGPTRGDNIVIATTLWAPPNSAQGFRVEDELKTVYASSLPAISVRPLGNSPDGDRDTTYIRLIEGLIDRIPFRQDGQDASVEPQNTPANGHLDTAIKEKDTELASLRAELSFVKNMFGEQSLALMNQSAQNHGLRDRLQQAEIQIHLLKTRLARERAEAWVKYRRLQSGLDTGRQYADAGNCKAETDLVSQLVHPPQRPVAAHKPQNLNPSLNVLDSRGEFPLYRAAAGGDYKETKRLLDNGADASMRTSCRWTSLHWAVANGHTDVVQLLLSYGADVHAMSDTGKKPISMAKTGEIQRMLLREGTADS